MRGGLWDRDANGDLLAWTGAERAVQQVDGHETTVSIKQTESKAILNWDSFNVGRNTTVDFQQQSSDSVLNRVVGADVRPSQIQGAIKGDGTVMVVNQNGVIFTGTSQVNVRNLVVAAGNITDPQFRNSGLYNGTNPTFTDATGKVSIEAGAVIQTAQPASSTTGGGYVLLLGKEVENRGTLSAPTGQVTLAAGDNFVIRKGYGTEGNQTSTTRGNEVTAGGGGTVINKGLIQAPTGDVTLTGTDVVQEGVVLATTSLDVRGTIHLNATGAGGRVVLGKDAVTAVLLEDTDATALDGQRDSLLAPVVDNTDNGIVPADPYRRDLSLIEIKSGSTVDFESGSLTLATGGQIGVDAGSRALVRDGAALDVSGAIGVKVAMEDNNLAINVQGNEQRDSPGNRDSGGLNSSDIWVDRRSLIYVPAGTNGAENDRWYTAGGLLEVSGYLATSGHSVGEWMAQGGTVRFTGNEVVTQADSQINLSGGTLDVQSGYIRQSWLRGSDGRLYEVSNAPGDLLYTGLYRGYETTSARWGNTEYYYSPLIGPARRYEPGYTVGRDAGVLVIGTRNAVVEGDIVGETFQGDRQTRPPQAVLDGYYQSQDAVSRGAQLVVGSYTPYYVKDSGTLQYRLTADGSTIQDVILGTTDDKIAAGLDFGTELPEDRQDTLYLDTEQLNGFGLGTVRIAARGGIAVDGDLVVNPAGEITLYGPQVEVNANLTSHGGLIRLGNVLNQVSSNARIEDTTLTGTAGSTASVKVADGAAIDVSGLWSNLLLDPENLANLPYQDGGSVSIRSSGDVILSRQSLIDVSSGAAVLYDGSFQGGRGGNITLAANANSSSSSGVFSLHGDLRGYGVAGGGTLDLQAGSILIGSETEDEEAGSLQIAGNFFDKGFSNYRVTGNRGVDVAEGTQVDVLMPVYRLGPDAQSLETGQMPPLALEVWTPPLYGEDPVAGMLTQRSGASLSLQAGTLLSPPEDQANIQAVIGRNAVVQVDPGQAIAVRSIGQLTVDGALSAQGGRIVLGSVFPDTTPADAAGHGRSIWIGEHAVLDVAGRAVTAIDELGNRYGRVSAGGNIVIGGEFDPETGEAGRQSAATGNNNPDNLFVVIRDGALLDASGSSAVLDIPGRGAVEVASAGGSITLASSNGLYLDGLMRAAAGGAGAAGGTLTAVLEAPLYRSEDAGEPVRQVRELVVTQNSAGSGLASGIDAEEAVGSLVYGRGRLDVAQVKGGGFDNLVLVSNGLLSFEGDVSLSLGQSLSLYAGAIGLSDSAAADSRIELAAPYIRLAGAGATESLQNYIRPTVRGGVSSISTQAPVGSFRAEAGKLLEMRDGVAFGARGGTSVTEGLATAVDRRGFDEVELVSQGDMRFLATTVIDGTVLNTPGDLTLAAAQIYPATGANATVYAGWRGSSSGDFDPERILKLGRTTDESPELPYSVFGRLTLGARTIEQGAILRAPLGELNLGVQATSGTTRTVNLLAGSLTSASANGLIMPYGGTSDGVTWEYDGEQVTLQGVGTLAIGSVTLTGQTVDVNEGAIIDLSGGGELAGAGFVSGRGGSTDARYNPLVQVGRHGFNLPGLDTNPVYAIVPGVQGGLAPSAASEAGAVDPILGQQITIGAGVPGLPAGTYTLLPSTYALLPGAFRVEINGFSGQRATTTTTALRNGSWSTSGVMSIAGTEIRDNLAGQVILTAADTLRTYSQYNETTYADFVRGDAARLGVPRAQLEADAKTLRLQLVDRDVDSDEISFRFDGMVRGDAAEHGYGSTLAVLGDRIEILGDRAEPDMQGGVAVRASDLSKVDVNRLAIGGMPQAIYGQGGNLIRFDRGGGPARSIIMRSGAELAAPEVMLIAQGIGSNSGTIEIEQGSSIRTLGQGAAAYDSSDGFIYQPGAASVLAVSNGRLQWLAAQSSGSEHATPIRIGTCTSDDCTGTTQLYSEGSIAFVTDNDFELDDAVRYGTRHLSLGVGAFNIGSAEALAAASARGSLTAGLVLNQQVMERLLQGDTSTGAPALETLELIAGQSVNFFDTVTLSTLDANGVSLLDNLILTTPAIYGYGGSDDVALIQTGNLIWNGSGDTPGAVASGGAGTGTGTLAIEAKRIEFGYGANSQPDGVSTVDRLALGFANVGLRASDRITANHKGSLLVYQSQGDYVSGEGYQYSGGNLSLVTPLLTGEAGSVNAITAGGSITTMAPEAGATDSSEVADLGAELSLTAGQGLSLDTTVALPSGKLTLSAGGDVSLGARAHLDLSGRSIEFFDDEDATQYSWGGDVKLDSRSGNIRQASGSTIDLSAEYNQAGRLTVVALSEGAGLVDLQGQVLGSASGHYNAGGTLVPYLAGGVDIYAQRLGETGSLSEQFAALNQRLNDGEVIGLRSFQLKQGDLTIGSDLKATEVNVSLDNGRLTVDGVIDASGERVGSIRLAGRQGLTLAGSAVLDAHGSVLRVDSYGQIIDSPNRAIVELNSGDGQLTLAEGARIDLRHGTEAEVGTGKGQHDGRARGTLELNAPRLGGATSGDIDIDASGSVDIQGARSIAVNAMQRYDDAAYGTDEAASGRPYQVIDQAYLDAKHADSTDFINVALANSDLLGNKLAGLNNATYRDAFHLRPGVEIVSATSDGDIIVSGDLDLSGHRYASLNPHTQRTSVYGSGEAGALAIRAGGDLSIFGSVNDGFAPPPDTPDDNGWVLTPGVQGYGGDVIVPGSGVELAMGTRFPAGKTLNYAVPLADMTLPAGTELPIQGVLASDLTVQSGTVLRAAVRDASGTILYAAGTVMDTAVTLPAGTRLDAGSRLLQAVPLAAMSWPANVALPVTATLAASVALPVGAVIPSMTDVKLPGDAVSVPLRTVTGDHMGRNWAVAAMLPEGSLSWSLRLVAGADTAAADPRLTRPGANGRLVLADSHYSLFNQHERIVIPGTPEQPGGAWYWNELGELFGFEPGTPVPSEWESLCSDGFCDRVTYVWNEQGELFGFVPGTPVPPEWESLCADGFCVSLGEPIPGTPDQVVVGDVTKVIPVAQNFSVLRTGTGDLDLIAGGDVAMQSLYGIYTAGTATASQAGGEAAAFDRARGKAADGTYLNTSRSAEPIEGEEGTGPIYESLVDGGPNNTYAAWYPDGGGNLLLRAGGNLTGDLLATYEPGNPGEDLRPQRGSANIGNWLWRQASGGTVGVDPIATSWWINFGTYIRGARVTNTTYNLGNVDSEAVAAIPELVGFTGIGTLGGGNLSVEVVGNAGLLSRRGVAYNNVPRSEGLVLAIGSSGRVTSDGDLLLTGGGDLRLHVGGDVNAGLQARATSSSGSPDAAADDYRLQNPDLNGVLTNLRGAVQMQAGELGGIALTHYRTAINQSNSSEVRAYDPYTATLGTPTGGIVLMLGDATAALATRGDLVLAGSGDPGRVRLPDSLPYTYGETPYQSGGYGWFSLWTENTAINLMSGGGDLAPVAQLDLNSNLSPYQRDYAATDGRLVYPSQLNASAASGSVFLRGDPMSSLILAPSMNAKLSVLAGDSIYAGGFAITQSGAGVDAIPTPFRPAFAASQSSSGALQVDNLSNEAILPDVTIGRFPIFAFGANNAANATQRTQAPVRLYARDGDIVGLESGGILEFTFGGRLGQTWYEGAGPVWMRAGRDIVRSGTVLGQPSGIPEEIRQTASGSGNGTRTGNLFVHNDITDVSIVEAGRDILYSAFDIAGPGTLEITAGRNILMAGQVGQTLQGQPIYGETAVNSIGPILPGDSRPGASVVLQAGLGTHGANYQALIDQYLTLANLAETGTPLADQPGKVAKTYENELVEWLGDRYGFEGSADEALAYFTGLASEQQRIFARQIYFAELREGGREYNDPDGLRPGSYLRGRNAIATLFPTADAQANKIAYEGSVLLYGGAGIHTDLGGDIQVLTPGGTQTYGVEGEAPPSTAGLITRGQGNIQLYSFDSILLGQSRIMTTFGGDILAWSAEGDINAGRGSKTTVVYTPPRRVYDDVGNVEISPDVPSTGAGIATLNPIPEVEPGDVDLIAPLGTIDAGEAGIRVSGNVNIAALHVVNAANIQVQGEARGIPVLAAVNVGALTSASAAASSATQAASEVVRQQQAAARQNQPSMISVQILGFGDEAI
ncbi:hypothetical protein LMG3431_02539 [Achromobacter pestifer]|uniref:Filamentous haemagglutinin FhaB/tRNA nuclease CdiA-like TPS domain-containing protein n=1 Tax=Achromobacter pestifer TaxID=1353889 RepID=A0A6S6ZGQ2_9BURK|nr:hypothetical protein LMG3431_02539 [Achromobacter pestifer]